jgi:ribosome-binding factor A
MPRDNRRAERVAAAIQQEIATYLAGDRDPRIAGLVTVTGVDVTPDFRRARVHVSVLGSETEPTLAALNQVGNRIRGQIGRDLHLRLAPELVFKLDESAARGARIDSLLAQIKAEERPRDD